MLQRVIRLLQRIARGNRVAEIEFARRDQRVEFFDVAAVHAEEAEDGQFTPHEGREPEEAGFPHPDVNEDRTSPFRQGAYGQFHGLLASYEFEDQVQAELANDGSFGLF